MSGLLTPFQRDQATDFANAADGRLLASKVRQTLATDPGELPWRTNFGAGMTALRHRQNDTVTAEIARVRASESLRRWIGNIAVTDVAVTRDDTTLSISVAYEATNGQTGRVTI